MRIHLVLIALAWPLVAHADMPCSNSHYRKLIGPKAPDVCRKIGDAGDIAIRHLRGVGALDRGPVAGPEATAVTELQDLVKRATAAAAKEHLTLPKLTLILDATEAQPEDRAAWLAEYKAYKADLQRRDPKAEVECPVAYHFKSSDARKLRDVAHGIYHCMKLGNSGADESAAEHFAGEVYPTEVVAPTTPRL